MSKTFRVSRSSLFFASLLVVVLFSSCFVSVFSGVLSFASGIPDKIVSNETDLRYIINNAPSKTSVVIAFNHDISLSFALIIPSNKDITLKSSGKDNANLFKLLGASEQSTIIVEANGVLRLDGIIVTRAHDAYDGSGVVVNSGGTLIMSCGEISGNDKSGVHNDGTFTLSGGKIFNNTYTYFGGRGGGVLNGGIFNMTGGIISNNRVSATGGGVNNDGIFTLFGGEISGNTKGGVSNTGSNRMMKDGKFSMFGGEISGNEGGGVNNNGIFTLFGGEISGNIGSGVDNYGDFKMSGGKISNNKAVNGGGVHNNGDIFRNGTFSMSGGEISGNIAYAEYGNDRFGNGGGVYNGVDWYTGGDFPGIGSFVISGGVISNNTATNNGGGVCIYKGNFKITGGKISHNKALNNGGGIWVDVENLGNLSIANGVAFSNNSASTAYNRDPTHDKVYKSQIGSEITWTSPFTQGYNNYDISYTSGSQIVNPEIRVLVIPSLILIVCLAVACSFFYFWRRGKKCNDEKLNRFVEN